MGGESGMRIGDEDETAEEDDGREFIGRPVISRHSLAGVGKREG